MPLSDVGAGSRVGGETAAVSLTEQLPPLTGTITCKADGAFVGRAAIDVAGRIPCMPLSEQLAAFVAIA